MTNKERFLAMALGQTVAPSPPAASAPVAAAGQASTVAAEAAPLPSRFTLIQRTGVYWSYPYACVGLIECPTSGHVVIHCTSPEVQSIELRGHGLDEVATQIAAQRLAVLRETDHPEFETGNVTIREIMVNLAKQSARDASEDV